MSCYSIKPTDCIFVKWYQFLSFAENMGKNIRKSLGKNCNKYSKKLLDHAKEFAEDALETTSKGAIQEIANVIHDLIGNKVADKIATLNASTAFKYLGKDRQKINRDTKKGHISQKKDKLMMS